jgi:fused signal recognition particle receptor
MFKFFKEKLKQAVSKFSKKVESESEEVKEEKKTEAKPKVQEKQKEAIKPKIEQKVEKASETIIEKAEIKKEIKHDVMPELKHEIKHEAQIEEPKKSIFGRFKDSIVKKTISEEKFNEIFWELEVVLLENNVAVEVIEKIKDDLRKRLVGVPIHRARIEETISESLKKSIKDLFDVEQVDLVKEIRKKADKPYVMVFFGVNGSGKTTTIAKVVKLLQKNNLSCVIAASDTFRAAAVEQLEEHANKLNVRLIKHQYGSDPAAVAFDAVKMAQARKIDAVLIDTAGRLHSNTNLMDEMKKIVRVSKPDMKIFIGESITGNDCVEQAKQFHEAIGIDGIILAKADVDEKGGAAISVSYITSKPILFLGTGQNYDDLKVFEPRLIMESLGLA